MAVAGTPASVQYSVAFNQGVDVPDFMAAAAAAEVSIPEAGVSAAAVSEFATMGGHEGARVDDIKAAATVETQLTAGGAPGFVQLVLAYREIPKDKAALALDPGALVTTIDLPLKDYSAIFEGEALLMTGWNFGGKTVGVYAGHDGSTKFIQLTQTARNPSGGVLRTEVVKLIVSGHRVSMAQVEKFHAGAADPYFSEYIVMPVKVSNGLALRNQDTLGRISDPALIKYVAEAPTPERIMEVLNR